MPAVTAGARERLAAIRGRTHSARSTRTTARQRLDAAREANDLDAAAVAQIAYDQADEQLQIAERLESQLLSAMAGVDGGAGGSTIFDDPHTADELVCSRCGEPAASWNVKLKFEEWALYPEEAVASLWEQGYTFEIAELEKIETPFGGR
jgi:hypothetical protein